MLHTTGDLTLFLGWSFIWKAPVSLTQTLSNQLRSRWSPTMANSQCSMLIRPWVSALQAEGAFEGEHTEVWNVFQAFTFRFWNFLMGPRMRMQWNLYCIHCTAHGRNTTVTYFMKMAKMLPIGRVLKFHSTPHVTSWEYSFQSFRIFFTSLHSQLNFAVFPLVTAAYSDSTASSRTHSWNVIDDSLTFQDNVTIWI